MATLAIAMVVALAAALLLLLLVGFLTLQVVERRNLPIWWVEVIIPGVWGSLCHAAGWVSFFHGAWILAGMGAWASGMCWTYAYRAWKRNRRPPRRAPRSIGSRVVDLGGRLGITPA